MRSSRPFLHALINLYPGGAATSESGNLSQPGKLPLPSNVVLGIRFFTL
jgi:hypothetical protein